MPFECASSPKQSATTLTSTCKETFTPVILPSKAGLYSTSVLTYLCWACGSHGQDSAAPRAGLDQKVHLRNRGDTGFRNAELKGKFSVGNGTLLLEDSFNSSTDNFYLPEKNEKLFVE